MKDPNEYPSVTRILAATKPIWEVKILDKWRQKIGLEEADKISQAALDRGHQYDKYIEDYTLGKEIPHQKLLNHINKFDIISREQIVYNHEYKYKGRYDCIFAKNGIIVLNDFKGSSKKKYRSSLRDYPLQIAAYIKAIEETGIIINWGMITVILDDDIQVFTFDHCEIEKHFEKFLKRLNQYNYEFNANF
jgi:genome maintenance exonuclease 1